MRVLKVPAESNLDEFMEVEDVLFVHFGLAKSCLDRFMSPVSMAGAGFWLPLAKMNLHKKHQEWTKYPGLFLLNSAHLLLQLINLID